MNRELIENLVAKHEGKKSCLYHDSRGIPTIGIGCNLLTSRDDIAAVGANYERIMSGDDCLTDAQVQELFERQINRCIGQCALLVDDFYDLPDAVQAVMVDLCFNLGVGGYKMFALHLAAIEGHDYKTAADELVDSKWFHQVGNRALDDVKLLREAA